MCRFCWPAWVTSSKSSAHPPRFWWVSLLGSTLHVLSHVISGDRCVSVLTLLGGMSVRVFSWSSPMCLFPFADFNLYPFTVINCSHEYDKFLSPWPSPWLTESLSLRVVWRTHNTVGSWSGIWYNYPSYTKIWRRICLGKGTMKNAWWFDSYQVIHRMRQQLHCN